MMRTFYAGLLAVMIGIAPGLVPSQAVAADALAGSWSGGGFVKPSSGAKERTRCRVSYRRSGGTKYRATASCSTTSLGAIRQTASLRRVGKGRYSGSFYNNKFDVSGTIYVSVRGKRQSVTLRSSLGYAKVSLRRR